MYRIGGFLARWGLLTVALVAAALVSLGERPVAPGAPVYSVPQVLAGYAAHPAAWVGRGVLVRAVPCDGPRLPSIAAHVPCIEPGRAGRATMLYDPPSGAALPVGFPAVYPLPHSELLDPAIIAAATAHVGRPYLPPRAVWAVYLTAGDGRGCARPPCLGGLGPVRVGGWADASR